MGSLSNLYISQSYTSLIHLGNDSTITTSSVQLQDGLGNSIGVSVNSLGNVSLSGSFSASLQQGYVWVGDGNNRTKLVATSSFSGGGGSDLTSLNAFTASQETKDATLANVTASLNANTASQQSQINSLIAATGSYALTSSIVPLTSLNAFTASQDTKNSTLASYTGSNDTKWNTLGGQTGSYVTSAITASSLITASVNLNTITFTKGNGTTFAITVNTGSGGGGTTDISSLNAFTASQETKNATLGGLTGSFATTGSNTFYGSQTIYGVSNFISGSTSLRGNQISIEDNSGVTKFLVSNTVGLVQSKYPLEVQAPFTASLTEGYAWVGNASGVSSLVATSSFGGGASIPAGTVSSSAQITALGFVSSSVTASSLVTASISGQLLTFTKGDSNQFTLTVPTGSGVYVTGSYGAFSDYTTQSGSANTAYAMKFNTTDASDGVILSGSTGLKVGAYGTYNLQWSGQLTEGPSSSTTSIWLRINGIDVSGSRGDITTSSNSELLPSWNYFLTLNQNDVVELWWSSTGANTTWAYSPVGVTPTRPSTASLIATLSRVDVGGGSNSVSNTIFNAYTASINAYTASNDTKWTTIGALTGSYATTGSNVFVGNETFADASGNASTLTPYSGSLILVAKSYTSASTHLSASANQVNLIFKNNNNTPDTILSGSANILVNAAAPTAGFKRYVTSANISLGGNVPEITGSLSTYTPTISNNYSNNIIRFRGPVSSSAWSINNNIVNANFNIGNADATSANQAIAGGNVNNNILVGAVNFNAYTTPLSASANFTNNIAIGTTTLTSFSSSIQSNNNIFNGNTFLVNNLYYGTSSTPAAQRLGVSYNIFGGINSSTLTASGSNTTAANPREVIGNTTNGSGILLGVVLNGENSHLYSTLVHGSNLTVTGSSAYNTYQTAGSTFIGRNNSTTGTRASSAETVFAVGTGTATGTRKTGFLIDSGSNTFVEGTLNVSGSSSFTGSVYGNVVSMSVTSNTASMDLTLGNYFELTSSASPLRIEVSNVRAGLSTTLILSASVSTSLTFSSNVGQPYPGAYSGSVTSSIDIISFVAFNNNKANIVATKNII